MGVVSDKLPVQQVINQLADAIGDGRSIKAVFMTDKEIVKKQARGSWLFFASEPCVRYMSSYTNLEELHRLLPELMTFKKFLVREKEAVNKTYLY